MTDNNKKKPIPLLSNRDALFYDTLLGIKKELLAIKGLLRLNFPAKITNYLDLYTRTTVVHGTANNIVLTYTVPPNVHGVIKGYSIFVESGVEQNLSYRFRVNGVEFPNKENVSNTQVITIPNDLQGIHIEFQSNAIFEILITNTDPVVDAIVISRVVGWTYPMKDPAEAIELEEKR